MTAQVLAAELLALIQESKRKNPDIRSAAETSLGDLKALPNTSEAQLAADLRRRPNFVRPFLLSCATRNPKYAGTAIGSLQRLVVSNGLAPETIRDVLDVLRDCTSLGQDVQLKILQALPSLLQNYASQLTNVLLSTALHTCFLLYASKTAVVSNTAAATLQQAVVSVFGKVAREDECSDEPDYVAEIPIEDGSVSIQSAALDGYQLLNDLCLLTEGQKPQFLHPTSVSPNFGLELLESILSNHADTVSSHPEQIHVLRIRLMPYIIRILSERVTFSTTVRVMRLLPVMFGNMLSMLATECEMVLGLLNYMLDPDAAILWKRVLCMEVFRGIYADPALVRIIYAHFDEQEGTRNIVQDHLAIMVRLAAEKPSIIGLGQQSSIPASSLQTDQELDEQAALQAEGIAGTIGAVMTLRSSSAPGISTQWSNMKVPCIDQLDKTDPPPIPPAYLYSLALTCMNSFSEGLARFLLPFSIPPEVRSKRMVRQLKEDGHQEDSSTAEGDQTPSLASKPSISRTQSLSESKIPLNPLMLKDHLSYIQIRTSADMIESCWPALLAAYSTFFHAALDMEYYHSLVRSFQKFSQIAGLLRLSTPRDAFLTTLGKNAIPPAVVSAYSVANVTAKSGDSRDPKRRSSGVQDGDTTSSLSTIASSDKARRSLEVGNTSLNTRNLLCLRALLNLGIALGPVLETAWSIVLETLQQADLVITHLSLRRRNTQNGQTTPTGVSELAHLGEFGNEVAAVKIAATRMLESCADLPDEPFLDVLVSFKSLLRDLKVDADDDSPAIKPLTPRLVSHQRRVSTAGAITGASQDMRLNAFVVENMIKLIEHNSNRLLVKSPKTSGWDIIVDALISVLGAQDFEPELRLKAASGLSDLINITSGPDIPEENRQQVRQLGLAALTRQVKSLYRRGTNDSKSSKACELDIHWLSLEALRASLEKYGDTLASGWNYVFVIIASIFEEREPNSNEVQQEKADRPADMLIVHAKSPKLVRSSFGSLQLICSDFLSSVPPPSLEELLLTIHLFCAQHDDFNIALTATMLFWNISGYLWPGEERISLGNCRLDSANNAQQRSDGSDGSIPSLSAKMWIRLLLFLTDSSVDRRLEVRHSALRTVFRIFDVCGDRLDSDSWLACLQLVILTMISRNEEAYQTSGSVQSIQRDVEMSGWNETGIVMLDETSSVLSHYLHAIISHADFRNLWKALGSHFMRFVQRKSLNVSAAVYKALSKILSKAKAEDIDFSTYAKLAWELWRNGNPVDHSEPPSNRTDNQAALLAYLVCLTDIYSISHDDLETQQVNIMIDQIYIGATRSSPTPYSGDVDSMTALQVQVLDCIRMIRSDAEGTASALIRLLSSLVTLAYDRDIETASRSGPTFIALSKAAMDLLNDVISQHVEDQDIYFSGSVSEAIRSLEKPIRLKYKWRIEGKDPPPWKKATNNSVTIIEGVVSTLRRLRIADTDTSPTWRALLSICDAIITVDLPADAEPSKIGIDQDFDIEAFERLAALFIPVLGSDIVNDKLRRSFTESLFQNSVIHKPHPDDLPQPGQELLECLQTTHIGRVQDLPPSLRSAMSYVLLDQLFDLVAEHDGSQERVRLAQAAAPYLILRVGIVLKAYNFDQPLRGRMPQPWSQRREMLYILHRLVELKSEPLAIPDAPGVVSKNKKHLYRVYRLVTKALGVARRNEEMQRALTRIIEAVSSDFGV